MPISVLVVDDSAFMRKALSGILRTDPELILAGTAFNGRDGLRKIAELRPDVVTLDVEMPEMDGLSALREIVRMGRDAPAVLMCSSLSVEGSRIALEALSAGAVDVIAKPTTAIGLHESPDARQLLDKIKAASGTRRSSGHILASARPVPDRAADRRSMPARPVECIVVGSSTGGPPALEAFLREIPAGFSAPILIAQHMPPMFTQSLAARLDAMTAIDVVHAETGMPLRPGTAYIGQGGRHIRVDRISRGAPSLDITATPTEALYRPSVNVLFASAAEVFGGRSLGVMLTGMGDDGLIGSEALVKAGGLLLGQDEASCVVYGMPKAVHEAGLVTAQMPPAELGRAAVQIAESAGRQGSTRVA